MYMFTCNVFIQTLTLEHLTIFSPLSKLNYVCGEYTHKYFGVYCCQVVKISACLQVSPVCCIYTYS